MASSRKRRVVLDDHDKEPAHAPVSQKPSSSSLTHFPNEILLSVLEQTSAAQLLELRLLSKWCCDAIDTRVFYHHIQTQS
jgi:hypothetical protein